MFAFDNVLGRNIFKIEKSSRMLTVSIAILICIIPWL